MQKEQSIRRIEKIFDALAQGYPAGEIDELIELQIRQEKEMINRAEAGFRGDSSEKNIAEIVSVLPYVTSVR
ncbi:MAG: hypothetical protein COX79_02035 [Candidatus Levybacteria bacterium CG_4_10_14_0_2_um_filter_36_16]|nr:MAG: hypothetical protein AUK12_02540 [Candidatus Levybacteria bacterium CG2_30_37_29]PIR79502.1 MAG: hypothetical protein COU26_00810 [Candidatus Levybacteria bacterium CG10_big_fil_rev_8_21_14_0_10_36_30]PIZ97510.1 MAG: hypothetical protein COX79_02035 [Candidatus Levybacteria bacterium CG_4_10_14_0_2_um_filter_36_16]PJA90457.1 MAG: hypothetical protein CO136_02020 [Candidatus Levybacteria bacterium CG_4_9_14_3_um_filter_36_7]